MTEETEMTLIRQQIHAAANIIDAYMVLLDEIGETTNTQAVSAFLGCPPANEVLGRYNNLLDPEAKWFAEQVEVFKVRTSELMVKYGELTLSKLEAMTRCTIEGCEDKEAAIEMLGELHDGDDEYA